MDLVWRGAEVPGPTDEELSSISFWSPVDVPGRPQQYQDSDTVAYRTRLPDDAHAGDEMWDLHFQGFPGPVTIAFDGERLARFPWAYARRRVPFEPAVGGESVVLVAERAPDWMGSDVVDTRFEVPAPWWELDIECHDSPYVSELNVTPRIDGDDGLLEAEVTVGAPDGYDGDILFSVRPEGIRGRGSMDRVRISVPPQERTTITTTLPVEHPERWHPRPIGTPAQYVVRAKIADHDRQVTVGFRDVSLDDDFYVNEQPVSLRGVVREMADSPDEVLNRLNELQANAIRCRGHIASPALYDRCARAGIIIWQDLPISGAHPIDGEELARLSESLARYLAGRPALGILCAHDEPEAVSEQALGPGLLDRLRFRWNAYRGSTSAGIAGSDVPELARSGAFVPTVSPPGTSELAQSFYPGLYYSRPADIDTLLTRYRVPLIGATGIPAPSGAFEEGFPGAAALQRRGITDPTQARTYQAQVCRSIVESARWHGRSGIFLRSHRDTDSAGGFGIFTAGGSPKPAVQAVSAAFEPLAAVLRPPYERGTVSVGVINDTGQTREVTVIVRIEGDETRFSDTVESGGSSTVGTVAVSDQTTSVNLHLQSDDDEWSVTYQLPS